MRKFKNKYRIRSYDDLGLAIQQLKDEVKQQENQLAETPIVKFAASFKRKSENKSSILGMLLNSEDSIGSSIVKTFLMTNKFTRKYFKGFMAAKEVIPQAVNEIKNAVKSDEE